MKPWRVRVPPAPCDPQGIAAAWRLVVIRRGALILGATEFQVSTGGRQRTDHSRGSLLCPRSFPFPNDCCGRGLRSHIPQAPAVVKPHPAEAPPALIPPPTCGSSKLSSEAEVAGGSGRASRRGRRRSRSGQAYLLLEGTDAKLHHVYYTPEIHDARSLGKLRINSFIRLRRMYTENGHPSLEIEDLGDCEKLLRNQHFQEAARRQLRRGIIPIEDGWSGWLGRYQSTLVNAADEIQHSRGSEVEVDRQDRSRGAGLIGNDCL